MTCCSPRFSHSSTLDAVSLVSPQSWDSLGISPFLVTERAACNHHWNRAERHIIRRYHLLCSVTTTWSLLYVVGKLECAVKHVSTVESARTQMSIPNTPSCSKSGLTCCVLFQDRCECLILNWLCYTLAIWRELVVVRWAITTLKKVLTIASRNKIICR
jgi:hypothetical protein